MNFVVDVEFGLVTVEGYQEVLEVYKTLASPNGARCCDICMLDIPLSGVALPEGPVLMLRRG